MRCARKVRHAETINPTGDAVVLNEGGGVGFRPTGKRGTISDPPPMKGCANTIPGRTIPFRFTWFEGPALCRALIAIYSISYLIERGEALTSTVCTFEVSMRSIDLAAGDQATMWEQLW